MTPQDALDPDDANEPEALAEVFDFYRSEQAVVLELEAVVRALLGRPGLTPQQIHVIAILLHGLRRLPRPTPGIGVLLMLRYQRNRESFSPLVGDNLICARAHVVDAGQSFVLSVELTETEFTLSTGGNTYDDAVGGDSFSSDQLKVGLGWRDEDPDWFALAGWLDSFKGMVEDHTTEVSAEDLEGNPIAWDDEVPEGDAWAELPDHP